MNRVSVSSSNISSVGFDSDTQTLEIEFTNGNIYQYFDVPVTVYEELMQAESKGKFLSTQIKGVYRYARL
jgi:hypothetical protein